MFMKENLDKKSEILPLNDETIKLPKPKHLQPVEVGAGLVRNVA